MSFLFRAALVVAAVAGLATPGYANCNGGRFAGPRVGLTAGIGTLDSKQGFPDGTGTSGHGTSFVPGISLGYDIQCDNVVAGIEGDINHLGGRASSSYQDVTVGTSYFNSKVDWYETVRGKLGVTVRNDLLLYGTAGLAFAETSSTASNSFLGFTQTDKTSKTGFVWGGGLELARTDRMLFTAEALHVDLGHESYNYAAGGSCCVASADWKNSFWVARVGVTWKLGEEPRYAPLK